ncbi:hypothetical protein CDL15_Pgr010004 [Punica granatum]|uniref:Uncharacterized protein n=1 Tax=Punica granatum TaxID=22663 RepID=A0A218X5Q4_PUNGR|nr:hypothetical protein CDL15_Pgr010004 [Punica granatum]PKI38837.1 hypothetical protein CRG98_040775 [Punica granatum]
MELSNRTCPKKRKISDVDPKDEERDEDDDEKIEKFFALIRTMREARDRLSAAPSIIGDGSTPSQRSKTEEARKPVSGWKPIFKIEDFVQDSQRIGNDPNGAITHHDSNSHRKDGSEDQDNQEIKVSLDLTLSL